MNQQPSLMRTARTNLVSQYDAGGRPYRAETKPYYSTAQFAFQVVDPQPVGAGNQLIAYAKLLPQTVEFFSYKLGDALPYGVGTASRVAVETDTNMTKPRTTNGVEDFVIETIALSLKSLRIAYAANAYTGVDLDVVAAHVGGRPIYDPAALITPPQLSSPLNLESPFFWAIAKSTFLEFEWDRSTIDKIAPLDMIPEGGPASMIRSNGLPTTTDRYRIPEGHLWRHEGQPGAEFIARARTMETPVIPINLALLNAAAAPPLATPAYIFCDLTLRLGGLSIALPIQ